MLTLLTAVDTAYASSAPASVTCSRSRAACGSVSPGSSQASHAVRGTTIGIRSWMCPTASVASVVITEQVRSQAESSSRSLAGSRQIS